jgi:SAM-dependent methyltransferase
MASKRVSADERFGLPTILTVDNQSVVFERAACNRCGSGDEDEVFRGSDRLQRLPGIFRVVRCRPCGLLRQNPRPTAETIGAYYPETYEPYSPSLRDESNSLRRLDRWYGMAKRRRLIEKHQATGRILDVGCATGNFLAEMKRTGRWQAVGIEPNEPAALRARASNGLDVRTGRLADLEAPPASFDVVTLWNVVEHVHEPIDDLRRAVALLKPGGWLVLSLPNLDSLEVRLFGRGWCGWDLPRHLYFFSRATLGSALAGLDLTQVERVYLSGSQISFALSLRCLYPDRQAAPLWNRLAVSVVPSLPARLVLMPAYYAFARLGQATTVTVVAQKTG